MLTLVLGSVLGLFLGFTLGSDGHTVCDTVESNETSEDTSVNV